MPFLLPNPVRAIERKLIFLKQPPPLGWQCFFSVENVWFVLVLSLMPPEVNDMMAYSAWIFLSVIFISLCSNHIVFCPCGKVWGWRKFYKKLPLCASYLSVRILMGHGLLMLVVLWSVMYLYFTSIYIGVYSVVDDFYLEFVRYKWCALFVFVHFIYILWSVVDISLSGQEGVKCLYLFAVQHLIICICTLLAHFLYMYQNVFKKHGWCIFVWWW